MSSMEVVLLYVEEKTMKDKKQQEYQFRCQPTRY